MIILTETCYIYSPLYAGQWRATHFFPTNLSLYVVSGIFSKWLRTDCRTGAAGCSAAPTAEGGAPLGLLLWVLGSLHKSWQGLHCLTWISRRLQPQDDSNSHSHREEEENKEADPLLLHPWPIPNESSSHGYTHGLRTSRAHYADFSHRCYALYVKRQEKKLQDVITLVLWSPGTKWGKSCCLSNTKRVEEGNNAPQAWLFKEPWPLWNNDLTFNQKSRMSLDLKLQEKYYIISNSVRMHDDMRCRVHDDMIDFNDYWIISIIHYGIVVCKQNGEKIERRHIQEIFY